MLVPSKARAGKGQETSDFSSSEESSQGDLDLDTKRPKPTSNSKQSGEKHGGSSSSFKVCEGIDPIPIPSDGFFIFFVSISPIL